MRPTIMVGICCAVGLAICSCQQGTPANQVQTSYSLEHLTAFDPSVSMPALEEAIRQRDSHAVLLTWLMGNNAETRTTAAEYFLSVETEEPQKYEDILDEIAKNVEARKAEIEAAEARILERRSEKWGTK